MRYDEGHKERTRERLLSEAAETLRADGPEGLSVGTLMKRAGLTHGGFYVHFESKDDLVEKAIDYMFKKRHAFIASLKQSDPRAALADLVENYLSPESLGPVENPCPIPLLMSEHHHLPRSAQKRFTLGVERLIALVNELLEKAGVAEPADLADSAVSEMMGAAALARVQRNEKNAHRILAAANCSVRRKLNL